MNLRKTTNLDLTLQVKKVVRIVTGFESRRMR
jgi:hypothetical protein